ncbi:MAG: glycosyltransferase family 2 protein [Candidatus Omnitrophica bacterium]|nr:glycosyltransferase family 2 protein [Candidatus Omnitrophota bacterium]
MASVSIVVIVKNEAGRIKNFLEKHAWADEIVVVDDQSADGTPQIARQAGALVLSQPSNGNFDSQRNAGAAQAKSEWILQMDADEIVPPPTVEAIRRMIADPRGQAAFELQRLNHFLGEPLLWGGVSGYQLKLYQKGKMEYVGCSVHETPAVDGKTGRLDFPVLHFPAENISEFLAKNLYYSGVTAGQYAAAHPQVSWREIRGQLLGRSLKRFWKFYVKKKGYRDGPRGFVWALMNVIIPQMYWMMIWEKNLRTPAR